MTARLIMKLQVVDRQRVSPEVVAITLKHPLRPELPAWTAGAHVDLRLPDGKIRQYSLCGDPRDRSIYRIAVKREEVGRGGSRWVHENLGTGSIAHCSAPRSNFSLRADARRHVLVGGGIGVTPVISMAYEARNRGEPFELHVLCRSRDFAPFAEELDKAFGQRLTIHCDDEKPADLPELLKGVAGESGAHLYFCGPSGLNTAIHAIAGKLKLPDGRLHHELFQAAVDENFVPEPFEITVATSGRTFHVPSDRSALDVLREAGMVLPSSCELGVCGACVCDYRDGEVIHRDVVLDADARKNKMTLCVSRVRGRVTVGL
ncbi:PDR/VanB family oxidoreductase [Aquamicrobium terrae]|uniref:Vanillate O-demethylase ferredoxin subunit n=1 Tax=Aquamicrobium terrae TaxID=1324945 RepID=A0ABV2N1J3_9HYPH